MLGDTYTYKAWGRASGRAMRLGGLSGRESWGWGKCSRGCTNKWIVATNNSQWPDILMYQFYPLITYEPMILYYEWCWYYLQLEIANQSPKTPDSGYGSVPFCVFFRTSIYQCSAGSQGFAAWPVSNGELIPATHEVVASCGIYHVARFVDKSDKDILWIKR